MISDRAIVHEGIIIGYIRLCKDGWIAYRVEKQITYIFQSRDASSMGYDNCVAVLMEHHANWIRAVKEFWK